MHIAVNLGVQKLGSFQVDNLLPEEIDLELNLAQRRFVKQKYSPDSNTKGVGFEQNQRRLDDLRNLIEDYTDYDSTYLGEMYTSDSQGEIFIDRYKLPIDYMHLLSVRGTVHESCRQSVRVTITPTLSAYLRIPFKTVLEGRKLVDIRLATPSGGLVSIKSNPNGLTLSDLYKDNYGENVTPSLSPNDTYSDLTSATLSADSPVADANEIFLKRERVGNQGEYRFYQVNSVGSAAEFNGAYAVLNYQAASGDILTVNINQGPVILNGQFRTPENVNPTRGVSKRRTLCKYVQHDDLYKVLGDPFNSTKSSAPLYTIQENFVDLYSNLKFVPVDLVIKYLRFPHDMNIARGIGSELPQHTHDEIVEMAVKSILEALEQPRYQTQTGEVLESE